MYLDNKGFIGYIYCITNEINKKKYIGQTIQEYEKRWYRHIYELNNNKHMNKHLQSAWDKYGESNFSFEILETLKCNSEEELRKSIDEKETFYISKWNLLNREYGYNVAEGGSNGNNFAGKSEEELNEIKRKKSESMKGKNVGKYHSDESKKKMSESHKGEKNPNYGKQWDDERKQKSSEKKKGKKFSLEHKESLSKAHVKAYVKCIELNIIKAGCNEMKRYLEKNGYPTISASAISKVCNGERKKHLGLHFEWIDINKGKEVD